MSMNESRYTCHKYFKHSQLISESISENYIIVHLVIWTLQAIECNRIKSYKQLIYVHNFRIWKTLHVLQRVI